MDFEKFCLESNEQLLENFARDLRLTKQELEQKLKLVGRHDQLVAMAIQVNQVYKQNPNAVVNFGDYGANIAKQLNLNPEEMFKAILVSGYNDLLISIVTQLSEIYKKG